MKSRFDGLDVFAMVCHLRRTLLGSKVVNIYDGDDGDSNNNSNKTFAFKLDSPLANNKKTFLILQSGIRFHDMVETASGDEDGSINRAAAVQQSYANTQPSPFCSKLRKHLRYSRLEQIQQIGQLDRVVVFTFFGTNHNAPNSGTSGPSSSSSCSLILELYSKGNLILTDSKYEILALLRSHVYQTTPTLNAVSTSEEGKAKRKNNNTNQEEKDEEAIDPKKSKGNTFNNISESEEQVMVKVGKIYPVTYATKSRKEINNSNINSEEDETETGNADIMSDDFVVWIEQQLQQEVEKQQLKNPSQTKGDENFSKNNKSKNSSWSFGSLSLRSLLLRNSSGVSHYGPALLEHVILCTGNLSPNQPLKLDENETSSIQSSSGENGVSSSKSTIAGLSIEDWEKLRYNLKTEAPAVLERLQKATDQETPGYLFYKDYSPDQSDNPTVDDDSSANNAASSLVALASLPHPDKTLTEFQPHLLKQHESLQYIKTRHFGQAVSDFFAQLQAQKRRQKVKQAEQAVVARLQNIQLDQQQRVKALEDEIILCQQRAMAVEQNATQVDQALQVVNSALDSGMDWEQLEQVVQVEQEEHANPIALLIKELQLEKDQMVLTLPVLVYEGGDDNQTKSLDVTILLHETAHANASRLFAQHRASREKSRKTLEASAKALEAAQATAERQLAATKAKQQQRNNATNVVRKTAWFEKFHWMITRDNYLVLAGRDAHQNELLVKRYLRSGDAYLHADVHGAASCILRAKWHRPNDNEKSKPLPLSEQALVEAGQFTICHSSAWSSRMVTSAWWVESHQVSKTAPSGEYLTVGSFMVLGKKNYLPPVPLEMGLAVLFRLGDAESIARHEDRDRRDFQMLAATTTANSAENDAEADEEQRDSNGPEVGEEDGDATGREAQEQRSDDDQSQGENDNPLCDGDMADPKFVINDKTPTIDESAEISFNSKKKKGLSVRDRKLIKKYGSLEEAERVHVQQLNEQGSTMSEKADTMSDISSATELTTASSKRGKKSKLKKQKKKYADQDEEDRELALMLLQGGTKEKFKRNRNASCKNGAASKVEEELEAATAAVLSKDSKLIAEGLPEEVMEKLMECLKEDKDDGKNEECEVQWSNIDGNVVEQLVQLQPEEAQLAAVNRLLSLKQTTDIQNVTMSMAGILRTIRKYGYKNLASHRQQVEKKGNDRNSAPVGKKNTKENDTKENETDEMNMDELDDTAELSKLTGKPLPEDVLLCAVPVCAPYSVLSQYQFRVKLTPGNGKRGKAAKQCVEYILKQHQMNNGKKGATALNPNVPNRNDFYRDLIKQVSDNEWVQTIIPDVKISAPGSSKIIKQQQQKGKGGKKKK